MQQLQHQTRAFSGRTPSFARKWQWVGHAGLIAAAFAFVGAVTLGLFP
jgi:hypothetical protein